MDDAGLVRVSIDLEPGREPVCGWLTGPGRGVVRFEGLLNLVALLDAARRPVAGGEPPAPERPRPH